MTSRANATAFASPPFLEHRANIELICKYATMVLMKYKEDYIKDFLNGEDLLQIF